MTQLVQFIHNMHEHLDDVHDRGQTDLIIKVKTLSRLLIRHNIDDCYIMVSVMISSHRSLSGYLDEHKVLFSMVLFQNRTKLCGIPLGSVLGRILLIHSTACFFADYCVCFRNIIRSEDHRTI